MNWINEEFPKWSLHRYGPVRNQLTTDLVIGGL